MLAARGRVGLDWIGLVWLSKEGRKRRASSARPYLGNRTWRYCYSLRACFSTFGLSIDTHRICVFVCATCPAQSYRFSSVVVFFKSESSCHCGSISSCLKRAYSTATSEMRVLGDDLVLCIIFTLRQLSKVCYSWENVSSIP